MRLPEGALLLILATSPPLLAGQAYDNLYRLYDFPKALNRGDVPV